MRKSLAVLVIVLVAALASVSAHDPRTTAKEVGVSLSVEGSGDVLIKYKAMHFNQAVYEQMKANDQRRERMNKGLWGNIGTADIGFDVVIGEENLPKGTYTFGINIDPGDQFSLVFANAGATKKIPLKVQTGADVPYLTLALTPTEAPDTFVLEGRCGTFQGTAPVQVPSPKEHKH